MTKTGGAKKVAASIGVFDSGIGGLTVLKSLRARFPNENFVYLGDTARIPYGTKSQNTIYKYLIQNLIYLKTRNVKAIVIACNSASSAVPDTNNDSSAEFLFKKNIKAGERRSEESILVYDVITPGAKRAARETKNLIVGIIGTKATVAKRSYVTEIEKLSADIKVFQQACPLLVPLVEEGWDDDPITNLIVYRYLSPLMAAKIDTLVMGCTHYPILKNAFAKVAGNSVALVDSSDALADELDADFGSGLLQMNLSEEFGSIQMLSTDASANYEALAARVMAPLQVPPFETVDIM